MPGAARPRALSAGRLHAPGGSTQSVCSVQMYTQHQALARPCCRLWGYRKADKTPRLREGEGARQTRGGEHARHGQPVHRPGVRKREETRVPGAARAGGELAGGLGRTGVGRSCDAASAAARAPPPTHVQRGLWVGCTHTGVVTWCVFRQSWAAVSRGRRRKAGARGDMLYEAAGRLWCPL